MEKPIQIIELIKTVATAFIIWLVVMGFWKMDAVQQATTLTFAIGLVNLGGAIWQNYQTTPLAKPVANDGEPLVRQSGDTRSFLEK